MERRIGKAFVRRVLSRGELGGQGGEATMILLLVAGDMPPSLTSEAMHAFRVTDDGNGTVVLQVTAVDETHEVHLGDKTEMILTKM